jgi:hypothetical protein
MNEQRRHITMRDLQKISAGAIQALPHPLPIKSGSATIGLLVPMREADLAQIRKAEKLAAEAAQSRGDEANARIIRMLDRREGVRPAPRRTSRVSRKP